MSQSRGKIFVVGAGIAGLSTAWALTRRGFSVEVFEQGAIPNPRASSYDEHRITRHAYGTLEGYGYLMPRAFALYDELFADIGARHFLPGSVVYFMRDDVDWYEPVSRTMTAMGKRFFDIPLAEVPDRFPMIETDGLTRVVETEEGGMLFPIRILTDLTVWLGNQGVVFHSDARVSDIDPEAGTLVANGQTHRADRIVIAAGAWVNKLTSLVEDVVVPSRQALMYISAPTDMVDAWSKAPVMIDLGTDSGTYTLPPKNGTRLKIGDHVFTRQGDADGDRIATEADLARLNRAARLAYKDFDRYRVLERKICFYTTTRDASEEFQVRPLGSRAWVVSACSGHGFKLGPLIGDGVAAAIAGERSHEDMVRYAAGRMSLEEALALERAGT
ncbi:NAD(P)/FAD-dependent oxidoreductase [Jiella mangrovi]|uniref:FAD-binding oxidoreductase n=1 Tax=Jiella mangrovi TaxID=2821407 RepID=A0ABS4BKY2_9HYPH|nr:FAD-binding oxidoreductase [Jiella mangrovi]MBP0617400.1 FAD-binding oxidoreductase [Jiella mangrovi]